MSVLAELVEAARERARALDRRQLAGPYRGPSFRRAISGKSRLQVIAEYKRRSPSRGELGPEVELLSRLRLYERAGAAAVSVLTEPTRFGGSLEDLRAAARALRVPVLMKDFVVDPAQVRAGARAGASAVLLIVRCLSPGELRELAATATACGLTALVECHTEAELERALSLEDAVIGVNNRDLDTLAMDLSVAPRLLRQIPPGRVAVAESGYDDRRRVAEIRGLADAVLVGSALMTAPDPVALIRELGA